MSRLSRALFLTTAIIAAFLCLAATRTSVNIVIANITNLGTNIATFLAANLTVSGALKVSSGTPSQAACADLSNGATGCSTVVGTIATQNYTATTWTPTFVGSSTSGTGQTYSTQVGSYEQIGRQVTVRWRLTATSLGTAAGNLQVGGLPLAAANVSNDNGQCFVTVYNITGLLSLTYGITGRVVAGGSVVDFFSNAAAGVTSVTVTQAGNTPTIEGYCNYHT